MKQSSIDNVGHKAIMYLIFLRTTLDLAVEEVNEFGTPIKHSLTKQAFIIYKQIVTLEKTIYNKNKRLSEKYVEAHTMCKPIWDKAKEEMGSNYHIYLEPLVTALYYDCKAELKAIGLNHWLFDQMMDEYFKVNNCELEAESTRPAVVVKEMTQKALFDYKKAKKREVKVA